MHVGVDHLAGTNGPIPCLNARRTAHAITLGTMHVREGSSADVPAILASGVIFNPRVGFEHMAVAEDDDGAIVGVAKAFRSGLHQTRYWTTVRVVESARLSGIGRELVQELAGLRAEDLPFAYRCRADDPALEFLKSLGATPYQVVPGLRLDLTDEETLAWIDALPDGGDAEIVSAESLTDDELIDAWVAMYEWTHERWSPVRSREDVARVFAEEVRLDLLRDASSFARRDGVTLAGVFAFDTPPTDPLELNAETVARDVPGAYLAACVRRTLQAAVGLGWSEISFEGHRDDPHITPLIESAPSVHGTAFYLMEYDPARV